MRKPVVTSVFIQTDMYQEHVAETVKVQKERCSEGKCYRGTGSGRMSRFSPASFIHGELKIVETNKKGSCGKKWIPSLGTIVEKWTMTNERGH